MIAFVFGGSGSGKSAFAESLCMEYGSTRKFYIATMQVYGEEGRRKVERHRQLRAGKGFVTIEQPRNVGEIEFSDDQAISGGQPMPDVKTFGRIPGTALLECLSNLTANEMFLDDGTMVPETQVSHKIVQDLKMLTNSVENLVVVGSNVAQDGVEYDESTRAYIRAMGRVHAALAEMADSVYEVVAGIPLSLKTPKQ